MQQTRDHGTLACTGDLQNTCTRMGMLAPQNGMLGTPGDAHLRYGSQPSHMVRRVGTQVCCFGICQAFIH